MRKPISPLILEKYLKNTCTDQERQMVEAWYASLHGEGDYLDTLPVPEREKLEQETFDHISKEIKQKRKFTQKPFLRWLSAAAASLILLAGVYTYFSPDEHALILTKADSSDLPESIVFENKEPRIVSHALPDGTVVLMHSNASITYPRRFGSENRIVAFKGEGFFDVAHDSEHPFVVASGELNIKVLGTKFNVKASSEEQVFVVSVVSGSVAVSSSIKNNRSDQVVLKAREQAFFETSTNRISSAAIPRQPKKEIYEPVTIQFDDADLNAVIDQLGKRFDVDLQLAENKMVNCRLTADFEAQPLPVILDMLCTSLDATYTMSEKLILINGTPCE